MGYYNVPIAVAHNEVGAWPLDWVTGALSSVATTLNPVGAVLGGPAFWFSPPSDGALGTLGMGSQIDPATGQVIPGPVTAFATEAGKGVKTGIILVAAAGILYLLWQDQSRRRAGGLLAGLLK